MKEIWIGGQCKHLKDISHLTYCQLCHSDYKKCDCETCNSLNCSCFCHYKEKHTGKNIAVTNDLLHIVLCPKLHEFWCYIILFATNCSIIFPTNERLLVWALITSHMSNLQSQSQINMWQNIYSIYISIFYKNYYFPEAHTNILINKFNTSLLRQLKVDHMIMINQIASIRLSDEDEGKIEEQITTTRSLFLSKWGHPFICQLNESDLLFINFNPIKLCSHWKKGEAKNKQNIINKEITTWNNEHKTKFDLQREKLLKSSILSNWQKTSYQEYINSHIIPHLHNEHLQSLCEEH